HSAHQVEAVAALAHPQIGDHQVELGGAERRLGGSEVASGLHGVAEPPEAHFEHLAHGLLVVDDEEPGHQGAAAIGTATRNVLPRPGLLRTESSPPCASTIRWAMARPRPGPRSLVVKNGSKIRFRSSEPMPSPESET